MNNPNSHYAIHRTGSENELKHWKYVKRERVNGKWRYHYDVDQLKDDVGVDELKSYKSAKNKYEIAQEKYNDANHVSTEFERASRNLDNNKYDYKTSHRLYQDARIKREAMEKRGKEYMSARTELMKTPIGKVVVAKETVSNWFKDLFD